MKACKKTLSALVCAVAASASVAATIDIKFDNNLFEGSGFDGVSIKAAGLGGGNGNYTGVNAGRFQGTASNLLGVPESILVDGVDDLYMYCYDIFQGIFGGAKVSYTVDLDGETARTLDFLGAVNQVLNKGRAVYDPYAWLHPVNRHQGAAIQLGIWESKYEDNKNFWDLGTGGFKAKDLDPGSATWWKDFIGEIDKSDSLDGAYVMVLENGKYQDMIAGDPPPSRVPEPGLLALMALGIGGLAVSRQRKAKIAA